MITEKNILESLSKEQLVNLLSNLMVNNSEKREENIFKDENIKVEEYNTKSDEKKSIKVAGKATRPVSEEECKQILDLITNGFKYKDKKTGKYKEFKPKYYLALILTVQATLGLRISDILSLTIADFKKGFLEIREKKTNKLVHRPIPENLISLVLDYALENGLSSKKTLTKVSDRNIRKNLKIVSEHLGYKNIGTHSFRKLFATTVYNRHKNIELLRVVLNHSSTSITQKYIGISQEEINAAVSGIDFSSNLIKSSK